MFWIFFSPLCSSFCFSLLTHCQFYISACSCQLLKNLKPTLPVPEVRIWHHSGTAVNVGVFSVKVPEAVLIWLCVMGSQRSHRLCYNLHLLPSLLSESSQRYWWDSSGWQLHNVFRFGRWYNRESKSVRKPHTVLDALVAGRRWFIYWWCWIFIPQKEACFVAEGIIDQTEIG